MKMTLTHAQCCHLMNTYHVMPRSDFDVAATIGPNGIIRERRVYRGQPYNDNEAIVPGWGLEELLEFALAVGLVEDRSNGEYIDSLYELICMYLEKKRQEEIEFRKKLAPGVVIIATDPNFPHYEEAGIVQAVSYMDVAVTFLNDKRLYFLQTASSMQPTTLSS